MPKQIKKARTKQTDRTRRMRHIIGIIRKGMRRWKKEGDPKFFSKPEIVEELERIDPREGEIKCSEKTVQRDIALLIEKYGAPIEYDRSFKGFCLTDENWVFDLPFTDRDWEKIYDALIFIEDHNHERRGDYADLRRYLEETRGFYRATGQSSPAQFIPDLRFIENSRETTAFEDSMPDEAA